MTLPNLLTRLKREATVIVPADRLDLLPGLVMAHSSPEYGPLAALLLTGVRHPESVSKLFAESVIDLPIAITKADTYPTAALQDVRGTSTGSMRKIEVSRARCSPNTTRPPCSPRSICRAPRSARRRCSSTRSSSRPAPTRQRIVLPESTDDRVLEAAAAVLQRLFADIILLRRRRPDQRPRHRARPEPERRDGRQSRRPRFLVARFAEEYARLRAHKGVTIEQARAKLKDLPTSAR